MGTSLFVIIAADAADKKGAAAGAAGWDRLTAAGCVVWGEKRVQKVQKVQRVQRVVDCPAGNAYKVSVTEFAFPPPTVILSDSEGSR